MIYYIKGDATKPQSTGPKIIVHCCNDVGLWGYGFVLSISLRWPEPEAHYRRMAASNSLVVGDVYFIQVASDCWVANLIGQNGVRSRRCPKPFNTVATESGLYRVSQKALALGASVHMPRLGCGLAGATWDEVEPLIQKTLVSSGVIVYVYDLEGH